MVGQPATITALSITQLPWEPTWDVPGIDLRAPLGVDIRIGSLVGEPEPTPAA